MTSPIDIPTLAPPQSDTPPDVLSLSRQITNALGDLGAGVDHEMTFTRDKLRIQAIHTELTELEAEVLEALAGTIDRAKRLDSSAINVLYDPLNRLVDLVDDEYPALNAAIAHGLYSALDRNLGGTSIKELLDRNHFGYVGEGVSTITTEWVQPHITSDDISAVLTRITSGRDSLYPQPPRNLRYTLRAPVGWDQGSIDVQHKNSRLDVSRKRLALASGSLAVGLSEPLIMRTNQG